MKYTPESLNKFTQEELNFKLINAAFKNDLKAIKILLTSPELKQHAQINADSRFLANICSNRDLKTLEYVLTSPELKEHANLHLDSDRALNCAIYVCDIPMVEYLLTSPNITDHSNLYAKNENDKYINFDWLFRMSSYENSMKLVDYLTLKYAPKKKDAKLFLKLIEYADDVDIEEQITNNLFSLIVNEKDIKYQLKLKKTLKKLDVDKYNMLKPFELKEELNKKLEKNPSNKNKKLKL